MRNVPARKETSGDPAARPARGASADAGFTLVEVTISLVILGMLMAALGMAMMITLRTSPSTSDRIDDARSTRGLSTWLAQDTTSTPPFLPEQVQGGIDVTTTDNGTNNDCGAPGTNVVHYQWTERATETRTFVANYRFVVDGDAGVVTRYTCSRGENQPYGSVSSITLTPALDPTAPPTATVTFDAVGDVEVVSFTLTGKGGESVLVETSSRNPADFFPSAP